MRYAIFSSRQDFPPGIIQMGCSSDPSVTSYGPMVRLEYIIHYVMAGKGSFNGSPVNAGEGFLIYPGQNAVYTADAEDPWEFLWVIAVRDEMLPFMRECGADELTQIFAYDFVDEVKSISEYIRTHSGKMASAMELLELLARLMKNHEKLSLRNAEERNLAKIAKDYLDAGFARQITIEGLTSMLGVSQPYLYRIFKDAYGMAPRQYLTAVRIREAKQLLLSTDMRISDVGYAVGCEDVLIFSKFFTRQTGISPSAYRSRRGQGDDK
ncbi:MAG: AraC family transcriptional regulator [Ruminococcaceae bacterium]|nr:AraC family transcriptional regulator [Oscillospiraceae bacterium]